MAVLATDAYKTLGHQRELMASPSAYSPLAMERLLQAERDMHLAGFSVFMLLYVLVLVLVLMCVCVCVCVCVYCISPGIRMACCTS